MKLRAIDPLPGNSPGQLARAPMVGLLVLLVTLAGCAAPTDMIDLRDTPQATRDAMLHVRILPIGTAVPAGLGSIGPVAGLGCGLTSVEASAEAVRQLQVKALRMRATAVADVLIEPNDSLPCLGRYGALAHGIAVAPRGIPPTY